MPVIFLLGKQQGVFLQANGLDSHCQRRRVLSIARRTVALYQLAPAENLALFEDGEEIVRRQPRTPLTDLSRGEKAVLPSLQLPLMSYVLCMYFVRDLTG